MLNNILNVPLPWKKNKNIFLNFLTCTLDSLLPNGFREDFADYCLWSIFQWECIDANGMLNMKCLDSGIDFDGCDVAVPSRYGKAKFLRPMRNSPSRSSAFYTLKKRCRPHK